LAVVFVCGACAIAGLVVSVMVCSHLGEQFWYVGRPIDGPTPLGVQLILLMWIGFAIAGSTGALFLIAKRWN
jgi:hypothetical protein